MNDSRNIYALLVGIDQYPPSVSSLEGCVNDIHAIAAYLSERVDPQRYQLHVQMLLNQNATRQAIINGFEQHLGQATHTDIVFFYYSGHGSQEPAPQEFWHLEPDHMNETLVCWDSREMGSRDLADKELAYLIYKLSQVNPQIVLVMDCCHSGSGTRDVKGVPSKGVRHAPADRRARVMDEFIFKDDLTYLRLLADHQQGGIKQPFKAIQSGWSLPVGRHILLAGCQDAELASEYTRDGNTRGAFSYFLLDTLTKTNGSLTYRELFKRANALVRSQIKDQSPQLEAIVAEDLERPFLGFPGEAAIASRPPYFTLSCDTQQIWGIDGGAVHGLPPTGGEPVTLSLYPQGANAEQMRNLSAAVGEIEITGVMPGRSTVRFVREPDGLMPETVWNAVVISLPMPPLGVYLDGDESAIARVRAGLAEVDGNPSIYVSEVGDRTQATYRVFAEEGQYSITKPMDNRPLVESIRWNHVTDGKTVVQYLEHMARWRTIAELTSQTTVDLSSNSVEMHIFQTGQEVTTPQILQEYAPDGSFPIFQLKLVNTTHQRLYCSLLDLTEEYSVSAPFFGPAGGGWIEPQSELWAQIYNPRSRTLTDKIPTLIQPKLWEQGITEYQDILKLIVSTTEFDATLLSQGKLNKPIPKTRSPVLGANNTLNRLMQRVTTRDLGWEDVEEMNDWVTHQITIVTVRPLDGKAVSRDADQSLDHGVTLKAHPSLQAKARLTSVSQSTRDGSQPLLPAILREYSQPFTFTKSRGVDPGLSVLELNDVENYQAITPDAPLTLVTNVALQADEHVLPVAYDGEFYLPLGIVKHKGGQTEIKLERLPQPTSSRRNVQGSIKIFFQKVVSKKLGKQLSQRLGIPFEYPILAVAEVADGEVNYVADQAQVKVRVAEADKIVLFVHGIFGDTESMVPSLETSMVTANGQSRPIHELYDLALTFDYESLNTSIALNAQKLKRKLRAIGLGPDHGKTLHIVGYSMGGLMARWLIEKEDAAGWVQHLFLLGCPNAGSPWPEVQAGVTSVVAFALNSLGIAVLPFKVLGSVLKWIETIDVTLDEMQPGSDFLEELAASNDPEISYSIIAGNTALMPTDGQANLRARLRQKLFKTVEFPFWGEANDIAVTVESMKSVSAERRYPPQVQEVACNHLVYFAHQAGLAALAAAMALAHNQGTLATTSDPSSIGNDLDTSWAEDEVPVKDMQTATGVKLSSFQSASNGTKD